MYTSDAQMQCPPKWPRHPFSDNNNIDDFKYEYIKSTANSDATINVFIKAKDIYYRVIFENNGGYKLLKVNKDIPCYIK